MLRAALLFVSHHGFRPQVSGGGSPTPREALESVPFMPGVTAENDVERAIISDPRWERGAAWGEPRPGHPEGRIDLHVAEVLENLDQLGLDSETRRKLRVVALVHDTFKNEVDNTKPKSGANHHAVIARHFVERYIREPDVLEIVELHDEAYNSWSIGSRRGDWSKATDRAKRLIKRLGRRLDLFLAFYRADNAAGEKRAEPLEWFENLVGRDRLPTPPADA